MGLKLGLIALHNQLARTGSEQAQQGVCTVCRVLHRVPPAFALEQRSDLAN